MVQYSGNIDEQPVSSVKAALDALAARKQTMVVRFTKQSSGKITADKTIAAILAAHSSGKPVTGIYASGDYQLLEAQGSVAYFASWTGADTVMLKGAASAGVDSWTLERLDIKGTNVALKGNIDGEAFTTVAGALALLAARGSKIEITLEGGASPAITSVTKDGVSVGSTVAEWANAVYEAVQKNWPIAFVFGNTYYRPSDVQWSDTSTMLQYLYFSGPSDISQFFQIRVWLYTDGRVPEITIDDQL